MKVARATTAAPTYFKPLVIKKEKFLDGGFGTANNPAWHAYLEVKQMSKGNDDDAVGLLVSIGTGKSNRVPPVAKKDTGLWSHYTGILKYAVATTSDSEDTHLKMLALTEDSCVQYERFNVDGGLGDVDLGEWRVSRGENITLNRIQAQTEAYLRQAAVRKKLEHVANVLVKNRQARSHNAKMWSKAATGYRYRCTVRKCSQSTFFDTEEDLRFHLLEQHDNLGLQSPGTAREQGLRLEKLLRDGKIPYAD